MSNTTSHAPPAGSPAAAVQSGPFASPAGASPVVASPSVSALGDRVTSVDAYRGFVMLLMMAEVLELARVSRALPDSRFWAFLAHHQSHVAWIGCTLHDLIQPSFSFLVGVALPFSLARRATEGQPQWRRTLHAFWRALVLVLLGVFLRSTHASRTNWTFEDTLTQIGLGYGFLYLLALRSARVQWAALAVILIGYWLAFAAYPLPGPGFDWQRAGVSPNDPAVLGGFAQHWGLNTNLAWRFDTWFLNLFPREVPFTNNRGGYATLSFIPTLGTMILGLIAGNVLRGGRTPGRKVAWLAVAGLAALAAGWVPGAAGVCPVVKRIWTPSWVLFSGGWCFLLMAGFYLVLDLWRQRRRAFFLVVVGMNSIAAYLIAHLFVEFISAALPRHLGEHWATFAGTAYEPLIHGAGVLLIEWLILWWMYRRRIFLRV
jgi:heparan-alpha-glucosaminide N-acetyltransferase